MGYLSFKLYFHILPGVSSLRIIWPLDLAQHLVDLSTVIDNFPAIFDQNAGDAYFFNDPLLANLSEEQKDLIQQNFVIWLNTFEPVVLDTRIKELQINICKLALHILSLFAEERKKIALTFSGISQAEHQEKYIKKAFADHPKVIPLAQQAEIDKEVEHRATLTTAQAAQESLLQVFIANQRARGSPRSRGGFSRRPFTPNSPRRFGNSGGFQRQQRAGPSISSESRFTQPGGIGPFNGNFFQPRSAALATNEKFRWPIFPRDLVVYGRQSELLKGKGLARVCTTLVKGRRGEAIHIHKREKSTVRESEIIERWLTAYIS